MWGYFYGGAHQKSWWCQQWCGMGQRIVLSWVVHPLLEQRNDSLGLVIKISFGKELPNAQNEGISKYVLFKYFCIILGNRNNFHVESLAMNAGRIADKLAVINPPAAEYIRPLLTAITNSAIQNFIRHAAGNNVPRLIRHIKEGQSGGLGPRAAHPHNANCYYNLHSSGAIHQP